jgi:hypothetical protein
VSDILGSLLLLFVCSGGVVNIFSGSPPGGDKGKGVWSMFSLKGGIEVWLVRSLGKKSWEEVWLMFSLEGGRHCFLWGDRWCVGKVFSGGRWAWQSVSPEGGCGSL